MRTPSAGHGGQLNQGSGRHPLAPIGSDVYVHGVACGACPGLTHGRGTTLP